METPIELIMVAIAVPIYAVFIAAELLVSYVHERRYYTTKGTIANIYLSLMNLTIDVLMRGICLGVLAFAYRFSFFEISNQWIYWLALLILQDLAFYLLHFVDHFSRFFWAVHVTHHSSPEFNLTIGFRSSVFQPLYRFFWFVPLTLLGFKPQDILLMFAGTQMYGVLIHTKCVGKLGFLEYFMATPSHHRVHHGSNPQYIDKNMGMVFIVWDRLFGTFAEEVEEVRYGVTKDIDLFHPIDVVFHEWKDIARDVRQPVPWWARVLYVFGPTGWKYEGDHPSTVALKPTPTSYGHPVTANEGVGSGVAV